MKFEDLSPADQALLNTDFGELDKVAAEMVKEAGECYERGFEKTALEIADGLDKVAEDEKEEKEEPKHDEETEKKAEQLAAFYERGVFDGLAKLGEARHGDAWHYLMPFIEEKIAESAAKGMVGKFLSKGKAHLKSMSPHAVMSHARQAATGKPHGKALGRHSQGAAHHVPHLTGKERAMEGGKAVGKGGAYLAGAAAAGKAVHSATKKD